MNDLHYIVSVLHTLRNNRYITFWRPNDAGYAWPLSWAGRYSAAQVLANPSYYNSGYATLAVLCSIVDAMAVAPLTGTIDNDAGPVVINSAGTWRRLIQFAIKMPANPVKPKYPHARRKQNTYG